MIDCGKCAIEPYCEYVLELDGTDGKCDDFVTIAELRTQDNSEPEQPAKANCRACMFEIECDKAWITDGRIACDSFCQA